MRLAALQFDIAWEQKQVNFSRIEIMLQWAATAGSHLCVLPEMFACGFSMNAAMLAESETGPTLSFMRDQAALHKMWICGSLPHRPSIQNRTHSGKNDSPRKPFNTLFFVGPSGECVHYHKIHPFSYAKEHLHYQAGDSWTSLEIEGTRITPFICYDLRFANEFWATTEHTDLYIVVANWPRARREHWKTLLQARAIENQAYVVGVNRVGTGGNLDYSGDSMAIDPTGQILTSAQEQETMLLVEISAETVEQTRTQFPFLPDRRRLR